jgi:ketosteroid isomerase-like protein
MRSALFVIALFMFQTSVAQGAEDQSLLQEQIRQLDLAHAEAILKGDAAALDRLMDDDVTVNHPTNRIVKEKRELMIWWW